MACFRMICLLLVVGLLLLTVGYFKIMRQVSPGHSGKLLASYKKTGKLYPPKLSKTADNESTPVSIQLKPGVYKSTTTAKVKHPKIVKLSLNETSTFIHEKPTSTDTMASQFAPEAIRYLQNELNRILYPLESVKNKPIKMEIKAKCKPNCLTKFSYKLKIEHDDDDD
uniref:Uncharacterized LOC100180200 n=1 Tax=Ciona intestinalis TaxID=7719 RepID=F6VTP3_CIOIN|nr:uncharacterized protein LOC100180200 [Ciona intestinalis]|eukprot:XP_002129991.1 uncharacterized protein LOC100180200 [Ciona intestinalis]